MTPLSRRRAARLPAAMVGAALALWGGLAGPLAGQPFSFSPLPHDLPAVSSGVASWADVDGDGDLDALVSGQTAAGSLAAGLYRNDAPRGRHADPVFTRTAALTPVAHPAAAWGDVDRDGDLDLVLAGSTQPGPPYAPLTRLYRNDGAGAFQPVDVPLSALHSAAAAWGDVDGDGDLDLVLTGTARAEAPYAPETHLYRNDTPPGGAPAFTEVPSALPALVFGDAAWGDVDGDGDADLALTGYGGDLGFVTALYRNDGGTLADARAGLPGLAFSTVDWGDVDGDGDLDLVLSGGRTSPFLLDGEVHVYRNDGGTFRAADLGLRGVLAGEAGWGDYDGDGDLDLLVLGAMRPLGRYAARLYENEGESGGTFRERTLLVGAILADAAWGDVDGDGDLDLLTTGLVQPPTAPGVETLPPREPATYLYRNDRAPLDAPPPPLPSTLHAEVREGEVALAWSAPEGARAVTYALRVGTAPGAGDVVAPAADAALGTRRLTTPGAAAAPAWTLRGLPPGTYHWGVQTVSAAFAGSAFAEGGTFTVGATVEREDAPLPAAFDASDAYPNPSADGVRIALTLPSASDVSLRVYNLLGETVHADRAPAPAGRHELVWDGRDAGGRVVASGVYLYELRTAHGVRSGRIVRVR